MNEYEDLLPLLEGLDESELQEVVEGLPEPIVASLLSAMSASQNKMPVGPAEQAVQLDPGYVVRPHTQYISDRLAKAKRDLRNGKSRKLIIETPPRVGKSTLVSVYFPLWIMRQHPWKVALLSYDSGLTTDWARQVRTAFEERPRLGVELINDGGAAGRWSTANGASIRARSTGQAMTGTGAKVLLIDDPVKDFADAHSPTRRQALWNWWLSVAQTRLEPPSLVVVTMTRWHEDDLVGRLLSDEYEGDPDEWEVIRLPALAEKDDLLDRAPGEPLLSPIIDETLEEALQRWEHTHTSVGTHTFAAMYQQRPAPAKGAIFNNDWWRFWTRDQNKVSEDGKTVVYLDPSTLTGSTWLDSWDCTFVKGDSGSGDYVVGQRWVRNKANRYLIAQQRGRWSFTETIERMERWGGSDPVLSPYGNLVHRRIVENKANGPAILDVLQDKISGLKPINPKTSKEARAQAVTPEIESGNVYLPLPSDPGNEWVYDFLSEMRNFPHDLHDDQVDSLTQALSELRDPGQGGVTVPGQQQTNLSRVPRSLARAAASDLDKHRSRR